MKDTLKETINESQKEVTRDTVSKVQPIKVPVKDIVAKDPVKESAAKDAASVKPTAGKPAASIEDRISIGSKREPVKHEEVKLIAKPPARETLREPLRDSLRDPAKPQVRQPVKTSPSKNKEASRVPSPPPHHGHHAPHRHDAPPPHKITVIKEDGKSRLQVSHKAPLKAPVKAAVAVPVTVVAAKPAAPSKKN